MTFHKTLLVISQKLFFCNFPVNLLCFVLSFHTGTELVTILKRKPDLIDQLALCLDRKMRLIPNWKHLARKLNVDEEVITKLEQFSDFSPTIRLCEYLEVTQPDLSIQQLRNALVEIKRNDLSLRLTKGNCFKYCVCVKERWCLLGNLIK